DILSLIDDQNGSGVVLENRNEKFIESIQQILFAGGFRNGVAEREIGENRLQQIQFGEERIQQQSCVYILLDGVQDGAAQRGFTCTDLPVNNHETFAPVYRVLEKLERAMVRGAAVEIFRIGSQTEGRLNEAVILFVHRRRRVRLLRPFRLQSL